MRKSIFLLLFISGLLCMFHAAAANQVELKLDTNEIHLGEDVHIRYALKTHRHANISEIRWDTLFLPLEVLNVRESHARTEGDSFRWEYQVHLIAFDTGHHVIYPVSFLIENQEGVVTDTLESEASLISVYGIEVNLEAGHRPLKDIFGLDWSILDIILWIIGAVLLLVILSILIFFLSRKPKRVKKIKAPPKKIIPPHEEALSRLEELKKKKLPESGEFKAFYIELTYILRDYLEKRYGFDALEQTTPETISSFERHCDNHELHVQLASLLRLADFVKFAKGIPTVMECEKSMEQVRQLIEQTKLIPESDKMKADRQ